MLSRRLFTGAELSDVSLEVRGETLLAVWLFLSRHADRRAYVFVREAEHEDHGGGR